jgi:hypothetical protein
MRTLYPHSIFGDSMAMDGDALQIVAIDRIRNFTELTLQLAKIQETMTRKKIIVLTHTISIYTTAFPLNR